MNRRIQRRMAIHDISELELYRDLLRNSPQEIDLLFNELLIGVTSFFRDPAFWDHLKGEVLPELMARRNTTEELRAWVIGCSTGEEAYSLAMVFAETTQRHPQFGSRTMKIFASDLSSDAIATARRGQYPAAIAEAVSAERLQRFFSKNGTHFQINKDIRDMVLFAHHDVVLDPPFTRLDLITCRNLLIYFDASLQRRLIPLFHYILRPGGVLGLGTSETAGRFNQLFNPINAKLRTYLRRDAAAGNGPDLLLRSYPPLSRPTKEPAVPSTRKPDPPADTLQTAADNVLLQTYAPAAVVVNAHGDIVYISGRTGNYLEPAAGKANWNFHAMVREGLRAPLANALKQAAEQAQPVQIRGLPVELSAGTQYVDVTVQAFHKPSVLDGMMMIVFRDVVPAPTPHRRRPKQSTRDQAHAAEIQRYQNEVQRLREESRASHEELQSTNEELQSTNEELQSANEELQSPMRNYQKKRCSP
jgi:two-component system, chemotaxis family, CheB/CheR fusion protein